VTPVGEGKKRKEKERMKKKNKVGFTTEDRDRS